MDQNKLREGVLCNLKFNRWTASAKLPKELLGEKVPKEIVRGMQDLIEDRTLLKDISTIRRTAKGELMRNSIPFPIEGVWFVPKSHVPRLDDALTELQTEDDKRVEKFLASYDGLKKKMKRKYPDYYRKEKYPSKADLRRRFRFSWQFFQITMPDKEASILDPKLYKREQEKFQQMVKQMEEMVLNLVAHRMFKRVERLAGQCDSGKINRGTLNSIDRFLEKWDDLWSGHVDDKKMKMVMARMKKQMKEVSADRLKSNEEFREKVGTEMDKVLKKLKPINDLYMKRRLDV